MDKDSLIEKLNEAELKSQIKRLKFSLKGTEARVKSGESRRERPSIYFDWAYVERRGREIRNKHTSYTRHRIAKIIHGELEESYPEDEIPGLRAIWNRLDFIPSKRTPKLT